ncbi:MAG: ABC transporter permease [Bacteroidales bacterium]
MRWIDMIMMGMENLFRSRLRTFLTLLGVTVGIGALSSMMSFGTGLRKNVTDAFSANDLFTSLTVFPSGSGIEAVMSGSIPSPYEIARQPEVFLTDSVIDTISRLPGVEIVIPDVIIPARIRFRDRETRVQIQMIPAGMAGYPPFNRLLAGEFYSSDSSGQIVIRREVLHSMQIKPVLKNDRVPPEETEDMCFLPADSLIGQPAGLISVSFDPSGISLASGPVAIPGGKDLLKEYETPVRIAGIMDYSSDMGFNRFRGDVMVSPGLAESMPRLGFNSVWDLLNPAAGQNTYSSLYVRVKDSRFTTPVLKAVENMGLGVFSMNDQLEEFKQQFLIFQSLLGAIGFIALFVAALGIINTMIMSIMERIREIGIMKSVGASRKMIRWSFFAEAATIGFFGGIFGLALGWLVTRGANLVIRIQLAAEMEEPVDLFYFPWWLLAGSVLFSVLVSLAAGLYPAARAARVDPVQALRYE